MKAASCCLVLAGFSLITVGQGGKTVPVPGLYVYPQNGTATVLALPTLGYEFDHWELDGANVSSSNPYTLTMASDHTLEAEFRVHVPKTWTVSNTGPADFHTISDAINSPMVVHGDVVLVKPGVYPEHVALKPGSVRSSGKTGMQRLLTVLDKASLLPSVIIHTLEI